MKLQGYLVYNAGQNGIVIYDTKDICKNAMSGVERQIMDGNV